MVIYDALSSSPNLERSPSSIRAYRALNQTAVAFSPSPPAALKKVAALFDAPLSLLRPSFLPHSNLSSPPPLSPN